MKLRNTGAFVALVASISFAQKLDPAAAKGYETISAADLSRHLHILASDSMEGRETAERGQKKAAAYIAQNFRELGLKAPGGSYFQPFQVRLTRPDIDRSSLTVGTTSFRPGTHYLFTSLVETTVTARAVFLGFADTPVDASNRERIAGRIAITLPGTRDQYRDTAANAQMMRLFTGRRDSGIVAQIILADSDGRLSFADISDRFARFARGSMSLADDDGGRGRRGPSGLRVIASPELAAAALRSSGSNLAALTRAALHDSVFQPVYLDIPVTITNMLTHELRTTENVLGMHEGSDPALRDHVVVVTAHYDHDGVLPDGTVYNGADDDGSGTVAMLELAEAFVRNGTRPRRSMLFIAFTGEERGLLGSQYYTRNPVIPLELTTANLNIDMIGRIDDRHIAANDSMYVYAIGSDKISPTLDSLLRAANDATVRLRLDYTYNDDNDPNRFYYRSDHYNFARNGVPVVFFFTGTHPDYHQPTDTPDKILYGRQALITRLVYATAWKVANRPEGLVRKPAPAP